MKEVSPKILRGGPNDNSMGAANNNALVASVIVSIVNLYIMVGTLVLRLSGFQVSWRSNSNRDDERQRLIRYDRRHPDEIFENGFRNVRNTTVSQYAWDLSRFCMGFYEPTQSPFLSTSRTSRVPEGWMEWYPDPHSNSNLTGVVYVYEIFAPGGIDINATFGAMSLRPEEDEVVFVGGIRREFIRSATEYVIAGGVFGIGRYFHNPRYRYVPELNLPPHHIPEHAEVILWRPPNNPN